jgi:hypothetical protein
MPGASLVLQHTSAYATYIQHTSAYAIYMCISILLKWRQNARRVSCTSYCLFKAYVSIR